MGFKTADSEHPGRALSAGFRIHARLGAIFAAGCFLYAAAMPAAAIIVTEGMVERQSAEVFEEMKTHIPLTRNAYAMAVVECVAYSIIAVLDGPHAQKNWEVIVFEDPSVNAFALAGGKIGVHTGIFKVAKNQHALAAVIGHEIAHVTEKHVVKRMNRQNLTGLGVGVLTAVIGGDYMTQHAVSSAMGLGAELGLSKPYDRGQETDADIEGLIYMSRAGFDPRATIELWKNMDKANKSDPPEFLSTHPSTDNRTARLVGELSNALGEYNNALAAGRVPNCE